MQAKNNNDFIEQCNLVIMVEKIEKTINKQEEAKNIFNATKPKLVALLNAARDESSFSLARFFGKTDRIKEKDVDYNYDDTSKIFSITIKPLKDVKSHTKPFIEKLFGKQILIKSSTKDRITVRADNTEPSVTIKLTMDELMSFCGTYIEQDLIDKRDIITNIKTHKQTQSAFCKEYHQKHLDSLISILKSSTLALRFHNNTPDTSNATGEQLKNDAAVKEYLKKILLEYQQIAVSRYSNMQNRIDNLKNTSQNTEIENIDTTTNTGRVKAMSIYLAEPEINNYNVFAKMYEAAISNTDKALMRTADILLNNAKLKTDLETEIASTTKQIALLITEHNDIKFYTKENKTTLTKELQNLKGKDKSLADQALKMIDKITVQQNTITATSGNSNSASAQDGNNHVASKLNVGGIDDKDSQSKLTSDDTAITATPLRKNSQQQGSSLPQRGHYM